MAVERCDECGFDGATWTDGGALDAIGALAARWKAATSGISSADLQRRAIPDMWSIAEYADHVREVLFGMRFLLDSAVAEPGVDLGDAPERALEPTPRDIDLAAALEGIAREARLLRDRLLEISPIDWDSRAIVDADEVDVRWVSRHAVHDPTHHLMDVERLRAALATDR